MTEFDMADTSARPLIADERPRILLVEDDEQLRSALARMLASRFQLTAVESGEAAVTAVRDGRFDVVLSDVNMPGMDGVALLRNIREHALDVPVILMTGAPALEVAVRAIEHGALRYLFKPLNIAELRKALDSAVELHRLATARRQSLELLGKPAGLAADRAGLDAQFTAALRALRMSYQPIVSWSRKRVHGYEALVRSTAAPLKDPNSLLEAALQLGRYEELSRAIRNAVAVSAQLLPPGIDVFVNLMAQDLLDEALYDTSSPLARVATRVVLEITERASLAAVTDLRTRIARLRRMGYRIAVDDLGAGYSGLASFAQLEPQVVKIDIALIRDVHKNQMKSRLVSSMVSACKELSVAVVAEGVELPAERDALVELGCDLLQGYLFARPAPGFPEPIFSTTS
jgi:EAL domain-containing protein (putative c-di-GMP-specific phosphodiesterase class I)